MKYLFFDCHGGFDLQMAASAMIDMSENMEFAINAAKLLPISAELTVSDVKRCSMDAMLVYLDFETDAQKSISDIIDTSPLGDKIKSRLKLWHKLRSDGKPRSTDDEQRELCYAALCLMLTDNIGAEKICISEILQGNAMGTDKDGFKIIPSPHTELLTKMAGLRTRGISIAKEILEPGAAALLYILNAEYLAPRMHNVIKSGYGASDRDLLEIPNIARCIIAEDGEAAESLYADFEAIMTDMEISYI